MTGRNIAGKLAAAVLLVCAAATAPSIIAAQGTGPRTFATPKEAATALIAAARSGNLDELLMLFGGDGRDLIASSDAATARANRDVFVAAVGQGWQLVSKGQNRRELVIGDEAWPFPVPIVKAGTRWKFDAALGKEEVLDRRIGRNELTVIDICHTYAVAQRKYAAQAHDGKAVGLYAKSFKSDPGKKNGLYWAAAKGEPRSPLGDLMAQAAMEGRAAGSEPSPLYGYYFKILTAQGAAVTGGAKSYIVDGELKGGFALVAWPAHYNESGVMTFLINQDSTVWQKDLGPETGTIAGGMTAYNPDSSWTKNR
jgi:hypothetical protein